MNWSGPNVIHFGRKSQFGPDQFILVVTISFWSRPNHYGQVQINLIRPKPFWTNQNCFGHIEGQGISVKNRYDLHIFETFFSWPTLCKELRPSGLKIRILKVSYSESSFKFFPTYLPRMLLVIYHSKISRYFIATKHLPCGP